MTSGQILRVTCVRARRTFDWNGTDLFAQGYALTMARVELSVANGYPH